MRPASGGPRPGHQKLLRGRLTSSAGSTNNTRPEPMLRTAWVTFVGRGGKLCARCGRGVDCGRGVGWRRGVGWLRGEGRLLGVDPVPGVDPLRLRTLHFSATCAPAVTPSFQSPPKAWARSSRRRRRRSSPRVRTPNRRRPRRLRRRWDRALRARCQEERLGTRLSSTSESAMLGPERLRPGRSREIACPPPPRQACRAAAPSPGRPVQHMRNSSPPCLGSGGHPIQGSIYIMQNPTLAG